MYSFLWVELKKSSGEPGKVIFKKLFKQKLNFFNGFLMFLKHIFEIIFCLYELIRFFLFEFKVVITSLHLKPFFIRICTC